MIGSASPKLVTAADLERLPEEERYELVAGNLVPMWDLSYERGLRTMTLSCLVGLFVEENRLGRCHAANTGFLLEKDPDTVLAVSFSFTREERMPPRPIWSYGEVVPDLVLLTRAPSTSDEEAQERVALWLKAGAKETWVLDLNRRCLTVHRSNHAPQIIAENEMLTCEDLLPGFSVPLREVFED
jgi:Uma2 family endonuclease